MALFLGGAAAGKIAGNLLNKMAANLVLSKGLELTDDALAHASKELMGRFSARVGLSGLETLSDGVISGAFEAAVSSDSLEDFGTKNIEVAFRRWILNVTSSAGMGGANNLGMGVTSNVAAKGLSKIKLKKAGAPDAHVSAEMQNGSLGKDLTEEIGGELVDVSIETTKIDLAKTEATALSPEADLN